MTTKPAAETWTIQKLIQWTTQHFASKQIPSARLDAEILLASVLKCRRLDLYLKFDQPLAEEELKNFKTLMLRRAQKEPIAYITGAQEFYGRNFAVGPGVLIPRPETELLVEEVLKEAKKFSESLRILDVGSGSGCIAVTLAVELPQASVTALEKMERGCHFTNLNAQTHGVQDRVQVAPIGFMDFDGQESFDIVVSNPPYIGRSERPTLQPDVEKYEPEEALFGGADGHETIQEWLPRVEKLLKPGGFFFCEIGAFQGPRILAMISNSPHFTSPEILKDYSRHDRILKAVKKQGEARG